MANEILFISSSMALLITSCIALILGIFFRFRHRALSRFASNPSVDVYSRTFNVFNPYPDRIKLISSFLTAIPIVVVASSGFLLLIFMEIVAAGLLLSLIIMIVSANLLVVDGAFEIYHNARIFITAFQRKTGLGQGDLRVLQVLRKALPRISNYYFVLAATFATFNLILPYAVPSLWGAFVHFMDFVFKGGMAIGIWPPFTVPLVWILSIFVITIFVRKLNNRFSRSIFS